MTPRCTVWYDGSYTLFLPEAHLRVLGARLGALRAGDSINTAAAICAHLDLLLRACSDTGTNTPGHRALSRRTAPAFGRP